MGVLWCSAATLEPNELLGIDSGSQPNPCTGPSHLPIEVKVEPKLDILGGLNLLTDK